MKKALRIKIFSNLEAMMKNIFVAILIGALGVGIQQFFASSDARVIFFDNHQVIIYIALISLIILSFVYDCYSRRSAGKTVVLHREKHSDTGKKNSTIEDSNKGGGVIFLLIAFLIIIVGIAFAVFYGYKTLMGYDDNPIKKSLQGGSLIISLTFAIIYYRAKRSDFKTLNDKLTFFSCLIITPPSIIGILF